MGTAFSPPFFQSFRWMKPTYGESGVHAV